MQMYYVGREVVVTMPSCCLSLNIAELLPEFVQPAGVAQVFQLVARTCAFEGSIAEAVAAHCCSSVLHLLLGAAAAAAAFSASALLQQSVFR